MSSAAYQCLTEGLTRARTRDPNQIVKTGDAFRFTAGELFAAREGGLPPPTSINRAELRELKREWQKAYEARKTPETNVTLLNRLSVEAALHLPALFEHAMKTSPRLVTSVIAARIDELIGEKIPCREMFRLKVLKLGLFLKMREELIDQFRALPEGNDPPHVAHAKNVLRLFSAIDQRGNTRKTRVFLDEPK